MHFAPLQGLVPRKPEKGGGAKGQHGARVQGGRLLVSRRLLPSSSGPGGRSSCRCIPKNTILSVVYLVEDNTELDLSSENPQIEAIKKIDFAFYKEGLIFLE